MVLIERLYIEQYINYWILIVVKINSRYIDHDHFAQNNSSKELVRRLKEILNVLQVKFLQKRMQVAEVGKLRIMKTWVYVFIAKVKFKV